MQTKIKKVLTQADIDNGPDPTPTRRLSYWREALEWLEGVPGWMLTIAVVVTAIAGIIGFIYLFGGPVMVPTAGRG